jgi:1,4-alpha-glucan branching enzyme
MDRNLEMPVYLFHQGTAAKAYELMGAHPSAQNGKEGYFFRVWAPNARKVSVMGDFNQWNSSEYPMDRLSSQGLWQIFIPDIQEFTSYKYMIEDAGGNLFAKADPYGFHMETRPGTASKTFNLDRYIWKDQLWQDGKKL